MTITSRYGNNNNDDDYDDDDDYDNNVSLQLVEQHSIFTMKKTRCS